MSFFLSGGCGAQPGLVRTVASPNDPRSDPNPSAQPVPSGFGL